MLSAIQRIVSLTCLITLGLIGCKQQGVSVSADGNHVAVSHAGSVWVADIRDEKWKKLNVESGTAHSPVWSPDGGRVLVEIEQPAAESSKSGAEDGAEGVHYAALFDAKSGAVVKLPADARAPFVWLNGGSGFVAAVATNAKDDTSYGLSWYNADGTVRRSVALPTDLKFISNLVALDADEEVAFTAVREQDEDGLPGVYCTSGNSVKTVYEEPAEDVSGLAFVSSESGGLLYWTSSEQVKGGVQVTFHRAKLGSEAAELATRSITVPMTADPTVDISIQSVTLSPNAKRAALVLQSYKDVGKRDASPVTRQVCFSLEADGSAYHHIYETQADDGELMPGWSADANRLVLVELGQDHPGLLLFNSDGSGKRIAPPPTE